MCELNQTATTKEQVAKLLEARVGSALMEGCSHDDIVKLLMGEFQATMEEACEAIMRVYKSWDTVESKLSLSQQDLRHWHIRLRQNLLQKFMNDPSVQGGRTALAVLDSLAGLHGVAELPQSDHDAEIRITFAEVTPEDMHASQQAAAASADGTE